MRDAILEFKLTNGSWLSKKVQDKKVLSYDLKDALRFECDRQKGEKYTLEQIGTLNAEQAVIDSLPASACSLRGDKIEKLYACELHINEKKSVDIYTVIDDLILLIECKYRASPETKIVSSVTACQKEIVE
jgi:hypothetical protein